MATYDEIKHLKGRGRLPGVVFRGEENACARLTEQQVIAIRQRYRRGIEGILLASMVFQRPPFLSL